MIELVNSKASKDWIPVVVLRLQSTWKIKLVLDQCISELVCFCIMSYKAKQEPWNQDLLKSRVSLRWQDKNPDSCISSFRHLPSGRKCNSSQGEIPIPYRVRVFVFLYYLDNELNVPWRMLKGWLERIAILLTINLSSRNANF